MNPKAGRTTLKNSLVDVLEVFCNNDYAVRTYLTKSADDAERIVQECIKLIEHMLYGNAMIAFHKHDGTFCLERGTLVGYEKFFHREFNITAQQESIIYWSEDQKGWRRFMIGNLMEWKAIV